MFQVLAIVNDEEFEEIKGIISCQTGYAFDSMAYSSTLISYRSPFVRILVYKMTNNQKDIGYLKHSRPDIVYVNRFINSIQLINNIFEYCGNERPSRIYTSSMFISFLKLSHAIDVLIVAETEHFDFLQEKLRMKCYNSQNRLSVVERKEQLVFYSAFIKIRVIRRRNDHYSNLKGYDADVVFLDKKFIKEPYEMVAIRRTCMLGNYGIHDISNLLEYGWCN